MRSVMNSVVHLVMHRVTNARIHAVMKPSFTEFNFVSVDMNGPVIQHSSRRAPGLCRIRHLPRPSAGHENRGHPS